MKDKLNAMGRVEAALRSFDADAGRILRRWRRRCPMLGDAPVAVPSKVPRWVWSLDRDEADDVLRAFVGMAQDGDQPALLAVVACMRPGLYLLVRQWMVAVDDVVDQAALRVLELPLSSRNNIAGGLVLDVRHHFWSARRESAVTFPVDPVDLQGKDLDIPDSGELPAGDELIQLVREACAHGALTSEEAQLVMDTRVLGDSIPEAAHRRGISTMATYKRRQRAEAQLANACLDAA